MGRSMEERPRLQTGPREIRPSGIIGGPPETWPWWKCNPPPTASAPELYPNTSYDPPDFSVSGNEALGMQLAQWNKDGPLLGAHLVQAIPRPVGAFAEAEAGGAH